MKGEATKREVGHLLTALGSAFEADPRGINAGLLPSIRDLTAEQAAWSPGESRHTIWQIVNHIAMWSEFLGDVLAGKPGWPDRWWVTRDWQPVVQTTEEAWRDTVSRLTAAHRGIVAAVEKLSDEQLDVIAAPMGPVPIYGWIIGAGLHYAYACGQIRYIRAIQEVPTERF